MAKRKDTDNLGRGSMPATGEQRTLVRLIRKYADMIDGVDLRDASVGDRLDLSKRDAEVLMSEGWAEKVSAAADNPRQPSGRRRR